MSKIIKLDKKLSNQISAGEVVERPVSVVKELVENSIDAGATQIKVEIKNGGIDEIVIIDNGEGIEVDDFPLVLEKYSTSKIKTVEDLHNIMTFGFRGEALASISSVSNFSLISKTPSSSFGNILRLIDSEKQEIQNHPSEIGTKIIIENLFYNTPARLNYLKKAKTEYGYIHEFLSQIALSYPHIGFEFVSDDKTIFKYKSDEDLKTRIYSIFGDEFYSNLIELDYSVPGITISGYISDPKVSFSNKNKQVLFVNNRIIKSPIIFKSITDAYNRFIPHSSLPGYVLNIKVDPTQVDVNVHPRKMEVRFANEQDIFRGIYHAIQSKLEKTTLINPPVETSIYGVSDNGIFENRVSNQLNENNSSNNYVTNQVFTETPKNYYVGSGTKFKSYSPYKDTSHNPNQVKIEDSINFSKILLGDSDIEQDLGEKITPKPDFNPSDLHNTLVGKIIGQTFNSYIIVETHDSLKILDQHALAERIIYEKLVNSKYKEKTQRLLLPETINLSPRDISILEEDREIFLEIGFDFEFISGTSIILTGIPDFIKKENLENLLESIISDISSFKTGKSKTLDEVRNKIFAYTACRSAVKFGNKLNLFEINKLLNDSVLDYSSTCPHGRPVVYEISLSELKGKYER